MIADMAYRTEARHRHMASDPLPWHPNTLPPTGFRLDHDGVIFEAVEVRPHERASYPNVFLITWRTHCTGCGVEMPATSTATRWHDLHRKRCEACWSADRAAHRAQHPLPPPPTEAERRLRRLQDTLRFTAFSHFQSVSRGERWYSDANPLLDGACPADYCTDDATLHS